MTGLPGALEPLPLGRLLRLGPSPQRRLVAVALLIPGLPLLTAMVVALDDHLHLPSQLLVFVAAVVLISAVGGTIAGLSAAVVAFVLANWFFIDPVHTLKIASPEDAVALLVFLAVAVTVSALVSIAAARSAEAHRLRAEAEVIAESTAALVANDEPIPSLLEQVRTLSGARRVVLESVDPAGTWQVRASVGTGPVGVTAIPIDDENRLVIDTAGVSRRQGPFGVLVRQLDVALRAARLRAEADAAIARAAGDAFRTVLLRAVSHDLRTPLTSVKTAVSSLRSHDVSWSAEDTEEFLLLIDTETDRLDRLIGNLLDMSRLEAGAVQARLGPVHLDDVSAAALASLSGIDDARFIDDVPSSLDPVAADEALLERALANLLANAARYEPEGGRVQVVARQAAGGVVDLAVVDHGPGIAAGDRAGVLAPFTQLAAQPNDGGIGLGLAIAHGFVSAMNGQLLLDETPGGGLTATIRLPRWT